jgi:hypothetical protein
MKSTIFKFALAGAAMLATPFQSHAFALLGPPEPWMTATNGLTGADIGGPMNLNNGYRWNTPVITYSFDASFLDYFGSNGVAAVDQAMQIINSVPPASATALTNYPFDSRNLNNTAQSLGWYDLKSLTLALLLEQLGLSQPERFMFVVRDYSVSGGSSNALVILRNFDPEVFVPTNRLNGTLFFSNLFWQVSNDTTVDSVVAVPYPVDPFASDRTPVTETWNALSSGSFRTGLTRDDVGGLRFLLRTNNYHFESLLPDVHGASTNANNWVNLALRGGIDKVTFIKEAYDSLFGAFYSPVTNQYTDTYLTNSILKRQQVERVTTVPDILFSASELGETNIPGAPIVFRTGTTNWINNAALNGNPGGPGPGVIPPRIQITFNKVGRQFVTYGNISDEIAYDGSVVLASFDGSTNSPIVYPIQSPGFRSMTFRLWLTAGNMHQDFDWMAAGDSSAAFTMQTSTNLTTWKNLFTVTNDGRSCVYFVQKPSSKDRFYRIVPQ